MKTSKYFIQSLFFLLLIIVIGCKKDPPKTLPEVSTTEISSITSISARSGGTITDDGNSPVSSRGVCWSTNESPTISDNKTSDGSGEGIFASSITGLLPGKLYYVRAYATNVVGTSYGSQLSMTTTPILPTITTTDISEITSSSAKSGGNITDDGGSPVTARGVCWSTNQNPTITDSKTSDGVGVGTFISLITELLPGGTYYARAYATNSVGTAYGVQTTIMTTSIVPILSTTELIGISSTSATVSGNITSDGGAAVIARGVCWSRNTMPVVGTDSTTNNGFGTGIFTSSVTDLSPGKTYYIRAYATNSVGTAYSNQITVSTSAILPVLTTSEVFDITPTTASSGGNITNDGGSTITTRGVCWSTSQNPTKANSITTNGTGTGTYTSSMNDLTPGETYYVRAYATNSVGTSYGNQVTFNASITTPTISTTEITAITSTTATSGGNITSDGGAGVTARGVCWSTSQNPTTANSKTTNGMGTGSFISSITALIPGATYYLRAYATNSVGTAYGAQISFNTSANVPTVTTIEITEITLESAICGGDVTNDGGTSVTSRGVCWSTTQEPTIANNKTINGVGTGTFVSNLTNLTQNTTYYVRAYATNSTGTNYGQTLVFKTIDENLLIHAEQMYPGVTGEEVTAVLNGKSIKCLLINKLYIYQGDILIPTEITKGFSSTDIHKWPDNTVYYKITLSPGMTPVLLDAIDEAINEYENKTNLIFKERVNEKYYVEFTFDPDGCGSVPGMRIRDYLMGEDPYVYDHNMIKLAHWARKGSVLHEIGHTIGLFHEHTRPDRDVYIDLQDSNIKKEALSQFEIGEGNIISPGFDWESIMLYPSVSEFSIDGRPTMLRVSNGKPFDSNREYLSEGDVNTINVMYPAKPKVTTTSVISITSNSATCKGEVLNDGGWNVYERGVCWGTNQDPTIEDNKITSGSGIGSYSCDITNLNPNTTYYVRSYAINGSGLGPGYGRILSFKTNVATQVPTVSTSDPSDIKSNSANVGGNVTSDGGSNVTEHGVYWSTNPLISGNKLKIESGDAVFSGTLTGLTPSTTYYVKAYAINSQGTGYGNQVSFTTGVVPVAAFTGTPTTINTGQSVQFADQSTNSPTSWSWNFGDGSTSTTQNPLHTYTTEGTYDVSLTATNGFGSNTLTKTSYITVNIASPTATDIDGNVYKTVIIGTQTWMAENLKTTKYRNGDLIGTTTPAILNIASQSNPKYQWAYNGNESNVSTYGRLYTWYAVTDSRNICPTGWHVPTDEEWTILTTFLGGESVAGGKLKESGTVHWQNPNTGTNSSGFTALPSGYRHFDGSFIINSTAYFWSLSEYTSSLSWGRGLISSNDRIDRGGLDKMDGNAVRCVKGETLYIPSVTTNSISNITSTSATSGGNITSDGGAVVTERGIYYSTNIVANGTKHQIGSGTGTFSTTLSGLTPNTTYYVKAYATNSVGTSYGSIVTFKTEITAQPPSLTTSTASNITSSSATLGGNVTSAGSSAVTERGIVLATTQNPTTSNTKFASGSGTGEFSINATNLTANQRYYVRAYAINSQGVGYGSDVSFTTTSSTTFIKKFNYDIRSILQSRDNGYVFTANSGLGATIVKISNLGETIWEIPFTDYSGVEGERTIIKTQDGGYCVMTTKGATATDGEHIRFVKVDANGTVIWNKVINEIGRGHSICATSDGGFIVTNDYHATLQQEGDIGVIKFDSEGNKQWLRSFGGTGWDYGNSIIQTKDGGYAVLGRACSNDGDFLGLSKVVDDDAVIIKINANGDKQWIKVIGGSGFDEGFSIIADGDNYVVTGETTSNDYDFSGMNHGQGDIYLVKLNSSGDKVWAKIFGGQYGDVAMSVVLTTDGGYFLSGMTGGSKDNLNIKGEGDNNVLALKTDSNGNIIWINNFGIGWALSGIQTLDGGYIITTFNTTGILGGSVIKINSNGEL